jgi:hypothetical protein
VDRVAAADVFVDSALRTCALTCKEVVALYLSDDEAPRSDFGRRLLKAAAAIDAAAAATNAGEGERHATFEIVAPICRAAADACRRAGLDPAVLRAAAACERAAGICQDRR